MAYKKSKSSFHSGGKYKSSMAKASKKCRGSKSYSVRPGSHGGTRL